MSPATEPVVLATVLAPLVTWLATRYGFDLTPTQATVAAGWILAAGSLLARSAVRTKRTLPDPNATKAAPPRE
jgi:uncharacterized protein (DUF697 family)